MSLEVREPASEENRPTPNTSTATTQADGDSLPIDSAYCVLHPVRPHIPPTVPKFALRCPSCGADTKTWLTGRTDFVSTCPVGNQLLDPPLGAWLSDLDADGEVAS
jgi:hypothetical protein